MKNSIVSFCLGILFPILSFSQSTLDDGSIKITFLQLNDVYEIAPLENGKVGGMARVAALRKKLLQENPNVYTVLAGDFLFPSAMGTISFEGKAMKGRQMVETMNAAGVDLVTFGNHEFDLKESELKDRINESEFDWVCANVMNKTSHGSFPFIKLDRFSEDPIPQSRTLVFKDKDGTTVRIGIFGICINSTAAPYVQYEDYRQAAQRAISELQDRCDFIVALTHLSLRDDRMLAEAFPQIRLITGGHEHVNSYDTVGHVIIAKADANARTVYIHRIRYDTKTKQVTIQSELAVINETIPEDGATKAVVDKWNAIADKSLRDQGFIPDEVLTTLTEPYDGRESSVRYTSTNLTRMIAKAFSAAAPGTECCMYNSGSIRLDDELAGSITQYDVIRTLPYGGKIMIAEMRGSLLRKALDTAAAHPGNGCFIQYDGIEKDKKGKWRVNGKKLSDSKIYKVAVNDYLVSGQQQFLEFLNSENPEMKIYSPDPSDKLRLDLRQAVIYYLRQGGK